MILTASASTLSGSIAIPGSKSHTIRAVVISSLAKGTSRIRKPLVSSDTLSAVDCYRALGAEIDISDNDCWTVIGNGGIIPSESRKIDVGNSGTTMNFAIGTCSMANPNVEMYLTGDHQIQYRPVKPVLKAVIDLGAKGYCLKNNGCPPVSVSGRLRGGKTTIECKSSQYLSSLLLCCPLAEGNSEITVSLLYEPDYARMTLDWLNKQGICYEMKDDLSWFRIPGGQAYRPFDLPVPADFSSATFFLCAGALLGQNVIIKGLDFSDSQPDKAVVDYLKQMGADITICQDGVYVSKSDLQGIELDMNRTPDALPAMAVTAAFAQGTTKLVNVAQARMKETDRIACMAKELTKLGADVRELPDGLIIHGQGGKNLKAGSFSGYGDHRIVMAMSIAAMSLEGKSRIDTAEAMSVTFPEYVALMKKLGADLQVPLHD
ncbi:MAG TPA: 3-phosphoshikimate 1-carboxyvinyltransferase [Anaerohalosphaeraceae bacterium]|nr:3-phosphoshikimate 1-carboxyvinyltransferase [Anaerohalosphaeraceae bacterium]